MLSGGGFRFRCPLFASTGFLNLAECALVKVRAFSMTDHRLCIDPVGLGTLRYVRAPTNDFRHCHQP